MNTEPPPKSPALPPSDEPGSRARPSRARRYLRRTLIAIGLLTLPIALYFGALEAAIRFPVNAGADPMEGDVEVYLTSNGAHVDLWVPARTGEMDWNAWFGDSLAINPYGMVAFGWGDEGFYLNAEEIDDVTLGLAANALLRSSPAALHVTPMQRRPKSTPNVHLIRVPTETMADLIEHIRSTFELDENGKPVLIDAPGYNEVDRFFRAQGSYSMFRTCNVWTNEAVQLAGKRAARWAPTERAVRFHLPVNEGRAR